MTLGCQVLHDGVSRPVWSTRRDFIQGTCLGTRGTQILWSGCPFVCGGSEGLSWPLVLCAWHRKGSFLTQLPPSLAASSGFSDAASSADAGGGWGMTGIYPEKTPELTVLSTLFPQDRPTHWLCLAVLALGARVCDPRGHTGYNRTSECDAVVPRAASAVAWAGTHRAARPGSGG